MGTTKKGQKAESDKSSKAGAKVDAKAGDKADKGSKRKLGLRGAAPWAARHAATHAAEAHFKFYPLPF